LLIQKWVEETYGDFWDRSEDKDDREEEHEACNAKVDPLDGLEAAAVLTTDVLEYDE